MDQIIVKNLLVRSIIGINPDERVKKQDILINLIMYADTRQAAKSDDIEDAINYKAITKRIIEHVETSSDFLVEKLVNDIACIILNEYPVDRLKVRVEKPGALRFAESVGMKLSDRDKIVKQPRTAMQTSTRQVYLLVGSNIDKEINVPTAIKMVRNISRVMQISSVYETTPMGLTEQQNFFNLAILIESELQPAQIKQQIIDPIEKSLNRKRLADKNAPRTIDLDIILYGDLILDYAVEDGRIHHLPDPDLLQFAHVAVPIAELAPSMIHPVTGQMMSTIAGNLLSESARFGQTIIWKRDDLNMDDNSDWGGLPLN